jgi:putative restriction endonuclease
MPPGSSTSMAYPFSRLKTDGFWVRLPKTGYDANTEYNIKSMNRLREVYYGARLDEELFQFMCDPETREQLRAALITTYFAPEVQKTIVEQGRVNYEAYEYSQKLLEETEGEYGKEREGKSKESGERRERIRDQAFRKTIVLLYDHRCALCGIRMLTPEGHTVVQAAHIIPWRESRDDRPTNGMSLCRKYGGRP